MRANTKKKHGMGRRFVIVIGVAATGVIALGAQSASSTTGDPVDSTPPDLQLSTPKKQDPQNAEFCDRGACSLIVRVSCGDEACTALATGKLTKVKMDKLPPVGPTDMCAPAPAICRPRMRFATLAAPPICRPYMSSATLAAPASWNPVDEPPATDAAPPTWRP